MTLKQAAKKYCDKFVIAIPVNDDERKMNREIRKAIDAHFTAGAAFERERILGLLRSVPNIMAKDMYDSAADYIESKLKEGDV